MTEINGWERGHGFRCCLAFGGGWKRVGLLGDEAMGGWLG